MMFDTKQKILITRPQAAAEKFSVQIEDIGFSAHIDPSLIISCRKPTKKLLKSYSALIFTSAHAVSCFEGVAEGTYEKQAQVFAIGPTTAKTARSVGYRNILHTGRYGQDLAAVIKRFCAEQEIRIPDSLLYVCGETTAGNVEHALDAYGIGYDKYIAYAAKPSPKLKPETEALLKEGGIDVACFFSGRSLEIFLSHCRNAGFEKALTRIKLLCIGPSVLRCVQPEHWHSVTVAPVPSAEGMVTALRELVIVRPGIARR